MICLEPAARYSIDLVDLQFGPKYHLDACVVTQIFLIRLMRNSDIL